jgi:hypothetical protein
MFSSRATRRHCAVVTKKKGRMTILSFRIAREREYCVFDFATRRRCFKMVSAAM